MLRFALALPLLLAASAALAQGAPRSIDDCEKIKGDLAYNQCLANFGPKVGERAARGPAAAEPDEDEAQPVARRGRGAKRQATTRRGRGGRMTMTFEVGGQKFNVGQTSSRRSGRRRR